MSDLDSVLIAQKLSSLGLLHALPQAPSSHPPPPPRCLPQPPPPPLQAKRVRWPPQHLLRDQVEPHPTSQRVHPHDFAATSSAPRTERKASTLKATPRAASRQGMTGMLDIDRAYARRGERTFVGGQCVVCDEPLEHTLRGERILQLSCSHVSHEACFYEYIRHLDARQCPECGATLGLDSGRGGNVVDIEKLSNIVRSLQTPAPPPPQYTYQYEHQATNGWGPAPQVMTGPFAPQQHEQNYAQSPAGPTLVGSHHLHSASQQSQMSRKTHTRTGSAGSTRTATLASYGGQGPHSRRSNGEVNGHTSTATPVRRHSVPHDPVQPPRLTLRSEYPNLTRSKQQQSLTCLITIEVPDSRARPRFGLEQASEETIGTVAPAMTAVPEHTDEPDSEAAAEASDAGLPQLSREEEEELQRTTEELHSRVDNWHGLEFSRFGPLRLHQKLQVGKDRRSWQQLECYLFAEMLICVKERKTPAHLAGRTTNGDGAPRLTKATLKGSIMIKKHLESVEVTEGDESLLTLNLSVPELPVFHLHFPDHDMLYLWERTLNSANAADGDNEYDEEEDGVSANGETRLAVDEEEAHKNALGRTISSRAPSRGGNATPVPRLNEYADLAERAAEQRYSVSLHAPVDFVVVIPVSASMHGIKVDLLRDSLRFLLHNLGPRDRMGLVAFGSTAGVSHVAGLASGTWAGWPKVFESLKAAGGKSAKGDLVEGANVAMDLLMQRKTINPVSSVIIISDSSVSESENIDFVISRAEAAKVSIFSFGLGLTHKPDAMIELSTRTEASYTYVKDWMMLRECVAGCLGSLQSISHQSVAVKLRLPEGSPARFAKISGGLQVTKRAGGRDAECLIGDLRFGDKRDILVQLAVAPESPASEAGPPDAWDSIISGLEALGGGADAEANGVASIEELPVLQADLAYGNILQDGVSTSMPRPSLLAITMLAPAAKYRSQQQSGADPLPIPPHASIIQRRMELLTSDMLTRSLALVAQGQHERAHHLLCETRGILNGLGKGSLPPLPGAGPAVGGKDKNGHSPSMASSSPATPVMANGHDDRLGFPLPNGGQARPGASTPSPALAATSASTVDPDMIAALDAELEGALEWINHPTVFVRDSRKAVLQAIGVISSQRAYTYRSPLEQHWARRVPGVRSLTSRSREWRPSDGGDDGAAS